jgi:hypothetical protein
VTKARIICALFSAAPFALAVAKLCIGTKIGGMNDGGFKFN